MQQAKVVEAENTSDSLNGSVVGDSASNSLPQTNTNKYPIVIGTTGDHVKRIQRGLNMAYNANLVEDGIYGQNTQNALLKYHKRYQIANQGDYVKVLTELNNLAK